MEESKLKDAFEIMAKELDKLGTKDVPKFKDKKIKKNNKVTDTRDHFHAA